MKLRLLFQILVMVLFMPHSYGLSSVNVEEVDEVAPLISNKEWALAYPYLARAKLGAAGVLLRNESFQDMSNDLYLGRFSLFSVSREGLFAAFLPEKNCLRITDITTPTGGSFLFSLNIPKGEVFANPEFSFYKKTMVYETHVPVPYKSIPVKKEISIGSKVCVLNLETGDSSGIAFGDRSNARLVHISKAHPETLVISNFITPENSFVGGDENCKTELWHYDLITNKKIRVSVYDGSFNNFAFNQDSVTHLGAITRVGGSVDVYKKTELSDRMECVYSRTQSQKPWRKDFDFWREKGFNFINSKKLMLLNLDRTRTDKFVPVIQDLSDWGGARPLLSKETMESLDSDVTECLLDIHSKDPKAVGFWTYKEREKFHVLDETSITAKLVSKLEAELSKEGNNFIFLSTVKIDEFLHRGVIHITTPRLEEIVQVWDIDITPSSHSEISIDDRIKLIYTHRPKSRFSHFNWKFLNVHPVEYEARDGLNISAYITTPQLGKAPYPTIVMPHGGPHCRDKLEYDPLVQWLASHGYLVFQPQFRGSKGFGKNFYFASDANWDASVEDVNDGVRFLTSNRLSDPDRVAIFGTSFGGYAVGQALVHDIQGLYKCGISVNGVFNLIKAVQSAKEMQTSHREGNSMLQMGGTETRQRELSPTIQAGYTKPMFLIHSEDDTNCLPSQSKDFADVLRSHGTRVTHATIKGEGHSVKKPSNIRAMAALIERFLGVNGMGGVEEPGIKKALEASDVKIRSGGKYLIY